MMDELFNMLMASPYGQYAAMVVFAAYVISHVIQYLPVSLTEKIPNFVMVALNFLAAKHGAASAAKTDIKGNAVE